MKKIFIFKLFVNLVLCTLFLLLPQTLAQNLRIISLAPNLTEIIYSIGAQNSLVGVSNFCNYPKEAQKLKKVGDSFYVNKEEILKLKPNYIFALSASRPMLGGLNNSGIKIIYFDFKSINDIYNGIKTIGKITGKTETADTVISELKNRCNLYKALKSKKILYLVQTNPFITIGDKSYITELIRLAGHKSVTAGINYSYPPVSNEFIARTRPDIIVMLYKSDLNLLKKLHPNAKFVVLNSEINDIINRPGVRIFKAIEYFSKL